MATAVAFSVLTGCTTLSINKETTQAAEQSDGTGESESITLVSGPLTAEYKKKDLDTEYDSSAASAVCGDKTEISGDGISESGSVITISKEGTYILSGSYKGQVLVDADEKDYVHIVLDGFDITNENGPAIYIKQCDKAVITLADGSKNSIEDGANYTNVDDDGEPDAALFSKNDMTINGTGTLNVTGNYADAIKCKKDLKFISGTYKITAASEGIKGRNSVVIKDGTFDIKSEDTAIKSTRDDSADKGYIIIDGGSITINAGNDAIHAETHTTINGGDINIESSYEGIEGQMIDITGGNINIKSSDDGINAARIGSSSNKGGNRNDGGNGDKRGGKNEKSEGTSEGNTETNDNRPDMNGGDGGKMPDMNSDKPEMNGDMGDKMPDMNSDKPEMNGDMGDKMPNMNSDKPEMNGDMDGKMPEMNGGKPEMNGDMGDNKPNMQDNGDRQAPPDDNNGNGGGPGFGGGMGGQSDDGQVYINISGGTVTVTGGGDCIDANGSLYLSGGNVYASSQRYGITDPDAVLDADYSIYLQSGVTFIGTGASSQISGLEHEQNAIYMYLDSNKSGTITVYDSGKAIASYTPDYSFGSIVITSPELETGKTYTVDINGEKTEVTLTEQVTSVGTASSSGGMGGGKGGMERNKVSFTDVAEDSSYYKAVSFLSRMGAMSGTSETTFSPDATLTRGMAVSVLGRLAKGTPAESATAFSDVADGMYYTDYVKWAAEKNIVSGYGNGLFGVNDSITQKQLQIILSNYAKTAGIEFTADENADDTPVTRAEFAQALYDTFGNMAKGGQNRAEAKQ
jgi:hypothetical protein